MSQTTQRYAFKYRIPQGRLWLKATGPSKSHLSKTRTHMKKAGCTVSKIHALKKQYRA